MPLVNAKRICYTVSMNPLKKIDHHSLSGRKGSAVRWANHEKVKTRLIRITEDDYTILRSLAYYRGSISAAVSFALSNCRRCRLSCSQVSDRLYPGV